MFQPKLSVITVVYNAARDIERTMLSVLNQSYPNIEYILIDGGSTDGSVELIENYQDRINKLISEKDHGIYHAMNKGLALATGDYVLFINAGDEIYATNTVEDIFKSQTDADIYYGETQMYSSYWQPLGRRRHKAPAHFSWKDFRYGMSICHQAIYIKRSIVEPYDLAYGLSADIDWIIKAAKKAKKIIGTDNYVAKYQTGGLSKKRHFQSLKERFQIFSKHYGLISTILNHGVISIRWLAYRLRNSQMRD